MAMRKAFQIWRNVVLLAMAIYGLIMGLFPQSRIYIKPFLQMSIHEEKQPALDNWRGLSDIQIKNLSGLGRRLFLGDESIPPRTHENFTILIWKYGLKIEERFIYRYGTERHEPFKGCSVSNCRITYNDSELPIADAVMFHLDRIPGRSTMPERQTRLSQRWVFFTDESPVNIFTDETTIKNVHSEDFDRVFNWSMTYRMDSDVPVSYGRTLPLTQNDNVSEIENKTKFAAIMISDCGGRNRRWQYIMELRKHMELDVYGDCGELKCNELTTEDCPKLIDYKFYLAFENSNCKEYITENAWWNAYNKGAVPVIMGAPLEDCARILPPNSYIHVSNFSSPADLAQYLLHLNETTSEYKSFLSWKTKYKVVNEHGYFQSPVYHYCRLCEALNYNDPAPKVYDKLYDFWSVAKHCNGIFPLKREKENTGEKVDFIIYSICNKHGIIGWG